MERKLPEAAEPCPCGKPLEARHGAKSAGMQRGTRQPERAAAGTVRPCRCNKRQITYCYAARTALRCEIVDG